MALKLYAVTYKRKIYLVKGKNIDDATGEMAYHSGVDSGSCVVREIEKDLTSLYQNTAMAQK